MGWTGRAENSGPVLFAYGNDPAETACGRGRKFAGGAAGEEVNTEQDNQADMDKVRIKPGK